MEDLIRINVIGGSASTAFALPDQNLAWPRRLEKSIAGISVHHETLGGMTFSQSISLISEVAKSDILILHFGTSVAWPAPLIRFGLRHGLLEATGFHQPPKAYSGNQFRRIIKQVKLRARNATKYVLFVFGAYKPRTSTWEIEDQVRAVLSVAQQKATNLIWLQHDALQLRKLFIERLVYRRYYKKIIATLKVNISGNTQLVELPPDFTIEENYLVDGVHLTEIGHKRLAEYIKNVLKESY